MSWKPPEGRGIVPEALGAVMELLFYEVGVNRIKAGFDANNPHSGIIMEKVSMRNQGAHKLGGRNNHGSRIILYSARFSS